MDRKDVEKFAHFQLTRQFEDLCCMPIDEMDDVNGNESGSKRGGSPGKNMKDLSEQKQFENLGKNGRIYQFEKSQAAQTFQEKMKRNHKRQRDKAFRIHMNLDNYMNHKR